MRPHTKLMGIVMCCCALMTPSVAQAEPIALYAAKFIGEYLLGKALDEVWNQATGQPDVNELQSRLLSFEVSVARVDAGLSRQITDLRKKIDTKVSKDEVRRIVRAALDELEQRIKKLEVRVDKLDARIKEIEELFGFLPTVTPAPLLRSSVMEGRPESHPVVVEWINLLCESETSRLKLVQLRREYQETSKTIKDAVIADEVILKKTAQLHQKTKFELGTKLQEREGLLREFKPTHPKIRAFDDALASLLWLVAVTKPIDKGEYQGRLAVPKDLLGSMASDILVAFELAGADVSIMTSLYRQLLGSTSAEHLAMKDTLGGNEPASSELSEEMILLANEVTVLDDRRDSLTGKVSGTEQSLAKALKDFSPIHQEVVALRKVKRNLLAQVQTLNSDCDSVLTKCLTSYVIGLRTERLTNPRMVRFRKEVIQPVYATYVLTDCREWDNSVVAEDTWRRFVQAPTTVISSIGMKLTLIPAGTFLMGSPVSEDKRFTDEGKEPHSVRISQPFYMGIYEVTQAEYESVMGTNPSGYSKTGIGSRKVAGEVTSKFPVESVSWFDAIVFCNKLSATDDLTPYYSLTNATRERGSIKSANVSLASGGRQSPESTGYRLPTEAEWEYACRANTTTPFHFGSTLNGDKANVNGKVPYGTTTKGNYLGRTTTVGSYPANAFGLFDMHGNVYEWCFDVYDESVYGKRSGTTRDPTVTSGSDDRVSRGGSYSCQSSYTRSANRNHETPDYWNVHLGFRVVVSGLAVRTP